MPAIKLAVNEPCNQQYGAMDEGNYGRLCKHCATEVIDFTKFNNADLFAYFQNKEARVCGRFAPFQLEQPIFIPIVKSDWRKKIAVLITSSLVLFTSRQVMANTVYPTATYQEDGTSRNKTTLQLQTDTTRIFGVVISLDDKSPLPGAMIRIKGSQTVYTADKEGKFNFRVQASNSNNLILQVNYLGYETREYVVQSNKQQKIILEMACFVMGKVMVAEPKRSKNLFSQLLQRVTGIIK